MTLFTPHELQCFRFYSRWLLRYHNNHILIFFSSHKQHFIVASWKVKLDSPSLEELLILRVVHSNQKFIFRRWNSHFLQRRQAFVGISNNLFRSLNFSFSLEKLSLHLFVISGITYAFNLCPKISLSMPRCFIQSGSKYEKQIL